MGLKILRTRSCRTMFTCLPGTRPDSDFLQWLNLWRQLSGYWWKRRTTEWLWQEGYWDYTLRDDESVPGIASYIVWNPVVAGLVTEPEDFVSTGSERFSISELASIQPVKPRYGDL